MSGSPGSITSQKAWFVTTREPSGRRNRALGEPIRHGRLTRRGLWRGIVKTLGIALGVLLISGGSLAAIATWDIAQGAQPGIHLAKSPGDTSAPDAASDLSAIAGGVNLLLTGTDTRTDQGGVFGTPDELAASSGAGHNDVNILLHISQDHQSVSVISFPRDLMLAVPACPLPDGGTASASSQVMLNTTLDRGGLPCVVLTIEKLTGISIPYAAQITFNGVTALSNAVGGVTVCLATPVDDVYTKPPLHLAAGQQTLVGADALSFLRSRKGVGDGSDLGRISNQQVFLAALVRKVVSGDVLGNPITLYSLAKAATSNMVLSDTLTNPKTLVQMALALKDTGLANMVFLQYPTVPDPADTNRVVAERSGAKVLNAALVADLPLQLTGVPGRAAVLSSSAPTVPDSVTTPQPVPQSPTVSAPSASPAADAVLPPSITGQRADQETCTKGNH